MKEDGCAPWVSKLDLNLKEKLRINGECKKRYLIQKLGDLFYTTNMKLIRGSKHTRLRS